MARRLDPRHEPSLPAKRRAAVSALRVARGDDEDVRTGLEMATAPARRDHGMSEEWDRCEAADLPVY